MMVINIVMPKLLGMDFVFWQRMEDDGAAYAAHINELLRTLNVNGDAEDSQPAETEE